MSEINMLAIDLAKRSFQVCALESSGSVIFNRTFSRSKLMELLAGLSPCIVAMEACATSHHWGRLAQSFGHTVRLIHHSDRGVRMSQSVIPSAWPKPV